jgi:cytochrome c oxidase subunit 2
MRNGLQSILEAYGPGAQAAAQTMWVMFIAGAAILMLVVVLVIYGIVARPERRRWLAGASTIVVGGIIFPVVVLSALLVHELVLARSAPDAARAQLRIEVIGEQWWWRVRYLDGDGHPEFETANEIRLPVAQPVELLLVTADVIHSFWVPNLAGKMDMIPGRVNRLQLQAVRPGTFRGQCAEYCGGAHEMMALFVVAEAPADFLAWRAHQRSSAREPETAFLKSGHDLFMSSGCLTCHRIRGTQALGNLGPDLTHVGSRISLAAGNLPNHRGTLAGWIAGNQTIKPGNRMPAFAGFQGAQLRALAEYLESLQ